MPRKTCTPNRSRIARFADGGCGAMPSGKLDDHLTLVAHISKLQIVELNRHNVTTVAALAAVPLPLPWKPERGAI